MWFEASTYRITVLILLDTEGLGTLVEWVRSFHTSSALIKKTKLTTSNDKNAFDYEIVKATLWIIMSIVGVITYERHASSKLLKFAFLQEAKDVKN